MPSELEFIQQLQRQFAAKFPVTTGIGDDGAVLRNSDGSETVIATDMLLDGVHFDLANTDPKLVGRKAVAVNLSDLAAMGCRPTAAFVSIAVNGLSKSDSFLQGLYEGVQVLSEQFEFTVAGGDTNSWDGPFAINVCVTGQPYGERAVLRSGAQPGDALLVTGPLGASLASGRHLSFEPRLQVSRELVTQLPVHAMMDVSDGLAIDLHRMMTASSTGAVLDAQRIPIHGDVPGDATARQRLQAALTDGEDFELLIAMPRGSVASAQQRVGSDVKLTTIGEVSDRPGCRISNVDGNVTDLTPTGWQHS